MGNMKFLSLCSSIWRRRRHRNSIRRQSNGREPEARKRETLHKKTRTSHMPAMRSSGFQEETKDSIVDITIQPPELDNESHVHIFAVELPADPLPRPASTTEPPARVEGDGSALQVPLTHLDTNGEKAAPLSTAIEATEAQPSPPLHDCPPCLRPGYRRMTDPTPHVLEVTWIQQKPSLTISPLRSVPCLPPTVPEERLEKHPIRAATWTTPSPQIDQSESEESQTPSTTPLGQSRSTADAAPNPLDATGVQRRPSLQENNPACSLPALAAVALGEGQPKKPSRASTWGEQSPTTLPFGSPPRRLGFASGCWSSSDVVGGSLSGINLVSPTMSPLSVFSTTSGDDILSTISPLSLRGPLSPETSFPSNEILPDSQVTSQIPPGALSPEPSLASKHSSANMNQLLARHALLESRRQILLKLHDIEQEQWHILEELATVPQE